MNISSLAGVFGRSKTPRAAALASRCQMQPLEQRLLCAAGDLDTSFGSDGVVWLNGNDGKFSSNCIAIQQDGKVLVSGGNTTRGDTTITRYQTNGKKDFGFGARGRIILPEATSIVGGLVVQRDGKIVAGHRAANGRYNLVRYTSDGKVDVKFGTNGATTLESLSLIYGLTATRHFIYAIRYTSGFEVERYLMNGTLDHSFGDNGVVRTEFEFDDGSKSYCQSVAVQSDGKVVVAGNANEHFALARYNVDGSLDSTFGDGGRVVSDLPASSEAITRIFIQKDRKILAVGRNMGHYGYTTALARYMPDGSLDRSFGVDGSVDSNIASAAVSTLQRDGKLVVAGETGHSILIARYRADGSLDPAFGAKGKVQCNLGGPGDKRAVFAEGEDNRVILVTRTIKEGKGWLVLVRYLGTNTSHHTSHHASPWSVVSISAN